MNFSDSELHTIYQALFIMENDKILYKYFKNDIVSLQIRIREYFDNKRKAKFEI